MLPPPVFARVDLASDYAFRQNPAVVGVPDESRMGAMVNMILGNQEATDEVHIKYESDVIIHISNEKGSRGPQLLNLNRLRRCVAYGTDFNASDIGSAAFLIIRLFDY